MPDVIVQVRTDGEFVECVRRERLDLPDGEHGILYAGCLFLLRLPGPHIEMSDKSRSIEDVMLLDSFAPPQHSVRLNVACDGPVAHLMIDGDSAVRDYVLHAFHEAGVRADVRRSHPDSQAYDWCITFNDTALATDLENGLQSMPMPPRYGIGTPAPSGDTSISAHTRTQSDCGQSLGHHRKCAPSPSNASRVLLDSLGRLLTINTRWKALRNTRVGDRPIALWRQQVTAGPRIAEELLAELEKVEAEYALLREQHLQVIAERDRLKVRLARKTSVASIMSECFPDIEFLRDSAATVDEDYTDTASLAELFNRILRDDPSYE